ncbi:hypothetical protein BD410DRAFT_789782 [Rickenella mellea]|uniref:DUF6699 domain-containing protein n=1 Tax=Rickenella mellea TaxID=50990 RepID=A0A4Y7Q230_9AGAM|nr:hypothetical protein BD410DRAFT_789782 [Rickenella mellea]
MTKTLTKLISHSLVYSYHGRETRRSQIHPLLSAESHRFKAILDLSASQPRLLVPSTRKSFPSTKVNYLPIHPGYLEQPATDPPMKHITITCPSLSPFISDWAINVGHPEASKPVSVGALLRAVQASLQTQIWQAEWSRLSLSRSAEVGEAYTRRCRALESFATAAEFQRNQGVRRVDFLVDRYFFGGVLWTNLDGMDCLKLIVKARST